MNEREVPPREADYPQVARLALRHPFTHFALTFCYCFTVIAIGDDLKARFLQIWPAWSRWHHYFSAFLMAISFYVISRSSSRFKAAAETQHSLNHNKDNHNA